MTKNENRKGTAKKVIILALAFILAIGCAIGGTIAWLTDTSDTVINTFSTSDITVTLTETGATDENSDGTFENEFQMIPGHDIAKDPKATVESGSEDCWMFVEVVKSAGFDNYMSYEIADGWTLVDGQNNVYAMKVTAEGGDGLGIIGTEYSVLKGDKVTVLDTVDKEDMKDAADNQPTLTFKVYAHQLYTGNTQSSEFTAADAWANLNPPANP